MKTIRPKLKWLADETVNAIVSEARRVLTDIGIFVENETAETLLLEAGSVKSADGKRILFADELADKALSTAPSSIRLYDRDGEEAMVLESDRVHFNPGSAALHVHDPAQGRIRDGVVADLEAVEVSTHGGAVVSRRHVVEASGLEYLAYPDVV